MLSKTMVVSLLTLSGLTGWLAACGGTGATTASAGTSSGEGGAGTTGATATSTSTAGQSSSTSTTASTSTSTSASTGTSGGPAPRYCAKECQTAADCKLDDGAYDTDNFACTGGACEFLGCKTDAECAITN